MQVTLSHDFEIPLDTLELAFLSPDLAERMGTHLRHIDAVTQKEHKVVAGRMERVLVFQPNVTVPPFARRFLTREMTAWDERVVYDLRRHRGDWSVEPHVKPEWRRYVRVAGSYELIALSEDRTRRVLEATVMLAVPVVRGAAERLIAAELARTFEAEAAALKDLGILV
jgi:hypothetical protein